MSRNVHGISQTINGTASFNSLSVDDISVISPETVLDIENDVRINDTLFVDEIGEFTSGSDTTFLNGILVGSDGIDTSSAIGLTIGDSVATAINIAKSGVSTNIKGLLVLELGSTLTGTNVLPTGGRIELESGSELNVESGASLTNDGTFSTNVIAERTGGLGVTVDNVLLKDSDVEADQIRTDDITEKTSNNGLTIEGNTLKDGYLRTTQYIRSSKAELLNDAEVVTVYTGDGTLGLSASVLVNRPYTITGSGYTANRNIQMPSAADLVEEYPGATTFDWFSHWISNEDPSFTSTLLVGSGGTFNSTGGNAVIGAQKHKKFSVQFTNVGGGSEAYETRVLVRE